MNISLKKRINWSFSLFVLLFVINGIVTIVTINDIKKLSGHLSEVVDPSSQCINDFNKMLLESKMYTTNWVFLRSKQEDKELLKKLHDSDYQALKTRFTPYSSQWSTKRWRDSLEKVYAGFEQLLVIEKEIMGSLQEFDDYDDPVKRLQSELKVEEEILPRTAALIGTLTNIHNFGMQVKQRETLDVERSSRRLRIVIIVMAIGIVCIGIILAKYMRSVIIGPIQKISAIVNDLGKGITRKIEHEAGDDEIGDMIYAVNHLSDKLQETATFAHEVGVRNFNKPFTPLSEEDTLGKALIMMRDNLRKSEERIELKNRELEQKNKELEQFAYVASHDLQEPIRTTSGFAELLQKKYKGSLDDKANTYLNYILSSAERMKVLINDLLDYSRIGRKKERQQVDCAKVLEEVTADLHTAIEEAGAIVLVEPLPVVYGYRTEIKQLFQNLVLNAIKFRRKGIPPLIDIATYKLDGCWQFSCTDNGIGIDEQYWERIFVIFQRLHNRTEYEGSGIGLAHCKKIVELHGGKIWVRSKLGEGATFYFTIPEGDIL